jgi:hypothetical protein
MTLGCLKFESEILEAHARATFTAVIARLDRATQYSGPSESHASGGDYWFPAFAGDDESLRGSNVPSHNHRWLWVAAFAGTTASFRAPQAVIQRKNP